MISLNPCVEALVEDLPGIVEVIRPSSNTMVRPLINLMPKGVTQVVRKLPPYESVRSASASALALFNLHYKL